MAISYKSFQSEDPETLIFQPHYLKQYNNRWYVLGYTHGFDSLSPRPLDRILTIEDTNKPYQEKDPIFSDYFEDIIGVTRYEERECEKIVLKFVPEQAPYIQIKPLHGPQKVANRSEDGLTISLELIPNYELENVLLGFGEKVEVISPVSLREGVKEIEEGVGGLWVIFDWGIEN